MDEMHVYISGKYDSEVRSVIRARNANISKLKERGITLFMCESIVSSVIESSCSLFLMPIIDSNLKLGFINNKCEIIIEPCYDFIDGAFYNQDNIVVVVKENLWNVIDCTGNILLDKWSKYKIVPSRDSRMVTINSKAIYNVKSHDSPQYIKNVISVDGFRYGFARIHRKEGWGIINEKGEEVLPANYSEMYSFYDYPHPTTIVKKNNKKTIIFLKDLK